jgi:GT2 family glycosyltransferase
VGRGAEPVNKALVVVPTYLTKEQDLQTTVEALDSVVKTQERVDLLCVDDGSPEAGLVDGLGGACERMGFELHRKTVNNGFSKTVNIGLQRALDRGQHAVLMNADVEIQTPGWLRKFIACQDARHQQAAVIGALLLFPNGTIQHAGVYFSNLTRTFDHLFKFGPGNLPEALEKRVCPVTGAFQFIRHSTLEKVGLYDEDFWMGWEDVDYCLRVFLADEQCVFEPEVRAYHFEMMFRGNPSDKIKEWQSKSFMRLATKYQNQSFAGLVPNI